MNNIPQQAQEAFPRIENFRVRNYRVLQDVELKNLTSFTVFLGPNGSGKSTLFDVFAFLSECFSVGLRKAWDRRGRFKELRTRGKDGPIEIEMIYREKPDASRLIYSIAISEDEEGPFIIDEKLNWGIDKPGSQQSFLIWRYSTQYVIIFKWSGEQPSGRTIERLDSREMLAVNTLGQFASNPQVSALRRFITGWYLSYLTADNTRGVPEAGPQEHLSETGDNLPNVIQYLKEQHPDRLRQILHTMSQRIPRLEKVDAELVADGRLLLQLKDAPFERPILAKFASDGTLKMLAYLTLLYDPNPPQLIGIEEPENQLHPRLLSDLAEECRLASARSELMVTSHSPYFVNGLHADELWVLYREEDGYTRARRAADMPGIKEFMEDGGQLGHLWMEGYFEVGDPLAASAAAKRVRRGG